MLGENANTTIATEVDGKPLAIAIMGPTASGKTELAIRLHQELGAEIISVDSALVYRGMNIGTAKPSAEELARGPHRLIDFLDPSESYSAAEFCKDASREIESIVALGKTPLLVGGTMLYFKALLEGLSDMPAAAPEVRAELELEATAIGWPGLHAELQRVDPVSAARIHPNHSQRISRALEVYRSSGKALSEWQGSFQGGLLEKYHWVQIAIAPQQRSVLHQRIALRFDKMLEDGLVAEVQALFDRGDLHRDMPAIRAVGYRQVWEYLSGETDFNVMRDKGVVATRQLAKRQLTWLRGWQGLSWLNTQQESGEILTSREIVNKALNFLPTRAI